MFRKYIRLFYKPIKKIIRNCQTHDYIKKDTMRLVDIMYNSNPSLKRVYYLGITQHSNLGDMGQHYCIKKWITENYPDAELFMFEATTVVDKRFHFLDILKKIYRNQDFIVFQSGYTTTDLGGCHDEMHRAVIEKIPYARILMMPQTIFFLKRRNMLRTSNACDQAKHMLFLARDVISYDSAKKMFPHVEIKAFPDIVTTLIGAYNFKHARNGICLCRRNDSEKYYSESDLEDLVNKLNKIESVTVTDTTIKENYMSIRTQLQSFIEKEIEKFSLYKVVITDRYHGTIFSLAAGTPVIIIKTTDHKVVTGADWFKGIYDNYVYVANNLDEAFNKAESICHDFEYNTLKPYFKENYYDKLKMYFEKV